MADKNFDKIMITYVLAKELKTAGFPQIQGMCGYFATEDSTTRLRCAESTGYNDGLLNTNKEVVYFPALSELIEACGEDLYSIQFIENIPGTKCYVLSSLPGNHHPVFSSMDPEEAVARLWLELNKNR